jgi:pyridoxal phosphate enzyme (YggS family)
MDIGHKIEALKKTFSRPEVRLVAVSKTQPPALIVEAYAAGQRLFGENRVQELVPKYEQLPKDIQWHLIGSLQTNKVKYIAPFVCLIHSIDSLKLLQEVNKEALKNARIIDCLLQVYIAKEETKSGLSFSEVEALVQSELFKKLQNVRIIGLMGMATNTVDQEVVRNEFKGLSGFFKSLKQGVFKEQVSFCELSMGMSGDYKIAVEEGSTLVRIGTAVFKS